MSTKRAYLFAVIAASALALAGTAIAQQGRSQPGQGPVAANCAEDIATYCPNTQHGDRSARSCLERNRSKVSAACRNALDTTGGGRGQGRGWQN
jgi:hypothetical protein